eukprot:2790547-Pleurochrysis_carterae.AAC.1
MPVATPEQGSAERNAQHDSFSRGLTIVQLLFLKDQAQEPMISVITKLAQDFVAKTERIHHDDVHSVEASKGMEAEVGRPVLSRYHMLSD